MPKGKRAFSHNLKKIFCSFSGINYVQQNFLFLNKKWMRRKQDKAYSHLETRRLQQNYNRHQKGQGFHYQEIIPNQQCVELRLFIEKCIDKNKRTLHCTCHKWHENWMIRFAILSSGKCTSNSTYIHMPFTESILPCNLSASIHHQSKVQ